MNVEDLFKNLSYGELSNLSIGMDGAGQIKEEDQPKIISHINVGLATLYTRFILSEKQLTLLVQPNLSVYPLKSQYARSHPNRDPLQFILDSPEYPFTDDLVKVLQVDGYDVWQEDVCDRKNPYYCPHFDVLHILDPVVGVELPVIYQAKHPKITGADLKQEIDLPYYLEDALQAFVGSKIFTNMNGPEHTAKGQEHMMRFESICVDAEDNGLVRKSKDNYYNKFSLRGWI